MIDTRLLGTVLWLSEERIGMEHVGLWQTPHGYCLQSAWVGTEVDEPVRAVCRLELDGSWVFRQLRVAWSMAAVTKRLRVQREASGGWRVNGERRANLTDCVDVDIAWSPMTNTLPIRRLGLGVGERRDLSVAYISRPELAVMPDSQRYTRVVLDRWLYESLDGHFSAQLTVDKDGLVVDYPPLFRRVAQWSSRS